jgi:hypothetical protein
MIWIWTAPTAKGSSFNRFRGAFVFKKKDKQRDRDMMPGGPVFPSAPGPSAVRGRCENVRIFDSCQSELPASVAPRSTAVPVRPRCPQPLAFVSSNRPMCVLVSQKCAGVHGRAQKLCSFMTMLSMQPCIESGTLSLRKRASRTVKVFS